jgi:hypothetical protein
MRMNTTLHSALAVLAMTAAAGFSAPIEKTGVCPTFTRSIAPPTASNGWAQFPIKPSSAFVTNCASGTQDNCTQQDPVTPAQSINCITVPEGLKAQLWASEEIKGTGADTGTIQYVQHITFDERGRVWAAEPRSYPNLTRTWETSGVYPNNRLTGGNDRILILTDSDGDGVMDKYKVFLHGINIPGGIEVVNGGVIVVISPYIVFYPNVNDSAGPPQILWHNIGNNGSATSFDTHFSSGYPFYHLENFIVATTGNHSCSARLPGVTTGGVECGARRTWRFKPTAM